MSTRVALIAGAAASLALMLFAGRHNPSAVLVLMFAGWVLSPFVGLLWANRRWPLHGVSVAIAAGSVLVYAAAAAGALKAKIGFIFLVVPAASWLLAGIALARAAASRQSARRE